MKAFIDRVNATLPVEQPDVILLAMLKNHQGGACGVPCPTGQSLASDGRCLATVIAWAAKKELATDSSAPKAAPARSAVRHTPGGQLFDKEGRMSLAGPQPPRLASARHVRKDAPSRAPVRPAAPPVRVVATSDRFPPWAMKAFNSIR
jgi:hypothetical protein